MAPVRTLAAAFLEAAKPTQSWSRTLIASLPERLYGGPLKIHYEESGKGDHPVLLLPGALGSTQTDFAPQLKLMKDDVDLGDMDILVHQTEVFPALVSFSPRTPMTLSPS